MKRNLVALMILVGLGGVIFLTRGKTSNVSKGLSTGFTRFTSLDYSKVERITVKKASRSSRYS